MARAAVVAWAVVWEKADLVRDWEAVLASVEALAMVWVNAADILGNNLTRERSNEAFSVRETAERAFLQVWSSVPQLSGRFLANLLMITLLNGRS